MRGLVDGDRKGKRRLRILALRIEGRQGRSYNVKEGRWSECVVAQFRTERKLGNLGVKAVKKT